MLYIVLLLNTELYNNIPRLRLHKKPPLPENPKIFIFYRVRPFRVQIFTTGFVQGRYDTLKTLGIQNIDYRLELFGRSIKIF